MSDREQEEQWEAWAVRAEELAKAGSVAEALDLVRTLPEATGFTDWAWQKTTALIAIAAAQIEQGHRREAANTLHAAGVSSGALRDAYGGYAEAGCLDEIARLHLQMGERREAQATWITAARLARPYQWHRDTVKVLARIATALLDIGEVDQAREVAESISEGPARDRALRDIALRARGGAPRNDTERLRFIALQAKDAAEVDRLAEARDLVRQIPRADGCPDWVDSKVYALLAIGPRLALKGVLEEAAEMAREARRGWEAMQDRVECWAPGYLVQIGQLLARVGARDEAVSLWTSAARRAERRQRTAGGCGRMLALLARGFAELGERDRAIDIATSIEDEAFAAARSNSLWVSHRESHRHEKDGHYEDGVRVVELAKAEAFPTRTKPRRREPGPSWCSARRRAAGALGLAQRSDIGGIEEMIVFLRNLHSTTTRRTKS
jgi:tetratricopeptide (TPR) repeat protein